MQGLVWRDAVAALAPHLDRQGLYWAISELRAEPVTGGMWAGIPEPWAAQREEVRVRLVERAEKRSGEAWTFLDDLQPQVPDNCSSLA